MSGRRIWITRPRDAADGLPRTLQRAGAEVIWASTIAVDQHVDTTELDRALPGTGDVDWIVFTSARAVAACFERVRALALERSLLDECRIAAVGPVTASVLTARGVPVEVVANPHSAQGLLAALSSRIEPGDVVFYPRARSVPPTLSRGLRALGARVVEAIAYQTHTAEASPSLALSLARGVDGVVFCSPSAVLGARAYRSSIARSMVACIGPSTERAARAEGLPVHVVPPRSTADSLARAIVDHFERSGR
jgi:uroporphyrinogen III methyltransferase/synthase